MSRTDKSIIVYSTAELEKLAKLLIGFAGDHKIWAFYGEMGSGKTTFIRSILKELGVADAGSSPTFSIVNEYLRSSDEPVYHFDFYRIKIVEEAINIGCEEYFYSGRLCLIEWPEKILNLVPRPMVKITIEDQKEKRLYTFSHE